MTWIETARQGEARRRSTSIEEAKEMKEEEEGTKPAD